MMPKYMFHGCCYGCTQQEINDVDFCYDCCNFNAEWTTKEDLNNRPKTEAELMREYIILKRKGK